MKSIKNNTSPTGIEIKPENTLKAKSAQMMDDGFQGFGSRVK